MELQHSGFSMIYTCCIPRCTTGYGSNKSSEQVSLFRFPKDKNLQKKWISAIPRKDWNLTNAHRVCAKHFCKEDFQTLSNDKCINWRKNITSQSSANTFKKLLYQGFLLVYQSTQVLIHLFLPVQLHLLLVPGALLKIIGCRNKVSMHSQMIILLISMN